MGLGECYQGCECFGAKPEFDGVLAYMRSCATPRLSTSLPWSAEAGTPKTKAWSTL